MKNIFNNDMHEINKNELNGKITLPDNDETKVAEEVYRKKNIYILFFIIPIIITMPVIIFIISLDYYDAVPIALPICMITILLGLGIYLKLIEPYRQLLQIAKNNDKIRYEEKIKFNEQQKLRTNNISKNIKIEDTKKLDVK
jgi:hypothetical protein